MVQEFSFPQELVDELQNDRLTPAKFLLVSCSFRDRARYHIFGVFVLYRFPDSKRKLITQIFTDESSIPPLVKSLHVYPFDARMNIILPLLRNVNHIHLQTGSQELRRFIKDAHVLSTYPLTMLHMGKPPTLPPATSILYDYNDFFDFVRCLPPRLQYVSLNDIYIQEPPFAQDTSTIQGPPLCTLNLRTDMKEQNIFRPIFSGISIFSRIDQLCLLDLGLDNVSMIVRSLLPKSLQKLCIHSMCLGCEHPQYLRTSSDLSQTDTNFTSLDCLHVPYISIWVDVFMAGHITLERLVEKLKIVPTKHIPPPSPNPTRLSSPEPFQYDPERATSDWLWESPVEHAHNVDSLEIVIINAVPYSEWSLGHWDGLVYRWTTKLRGHLAHFGSFIVS